MKKLILLSILIIVGCGTEPEEGCLYDCEGTCNGDAREDSCGVCDTVPSNDCVQDCAEVWGGEAVEDCTGECNGTATIDLCGNCSNNNILCEQDCLGEWGGNAVIGECGLCINSYLTCPEEEECYNVGYNDPCPDLGCCPYPYVKSCSCDGKCGNVLRIGDGGCDKPGLGGGHDGWDGRCYFEDGGDCE